MTDKVQKIRAFLVGIADADGVSTILAKAIEKKILPYIDSLQEEPTIPDIVDKHYWEMLGEEQQEPISDFEKALVEMIAKAQKCVVEPIVVAQQWKDYLIELAKSEEPVSIWHDASKIPDNSEDIVIEHSEYGITIIPACKMSRVKGAKWARLDDILKL